MWACGRAHVGVRAPACECVHACARARECARAVARSCSSARVRGAQGSDARRLQVHGLAVCLEAGTGVCGEARQVRAGRVRGREAEKEEELESTLRVHACSSRDARTARMPPMYSSAARRERQGRRSPVRGAATRQRVGSGRVFSLESGCDGCAAAQRVPKAENRVAVWVGRWVVAANNELHQV